MHVTASPGVLDQRAWLLCRVNCGLPNHKARAWFQTRCLRLHICLSPGGWGARLPTQSPSLPDHVLHSKCSAPCPLTPELVLLWAGSIPTPPEVQGTSPGRGSLTVTPCPPSLGLALGVVRAPPGGPMSLASSCVSLSVSGYSSVGWSVSCVPWAYSLVLHRALCRWDRQQAPLHPGLVIAHREWRQWVLRTRTCSWVDT